MIKVGQRAIKNLSGDAQKNVFYFCPPPATLEHYLFQKVSDLSLTWCSYKNISAKRSDGQRIPEKTLSSVHVQIHVINTGIVLKSHIGVRVCTHLCEGSLISTTLAELPWDVDGMATKPSAIMSMSARDNRTSTNKAIVPAPLLWPRLSFAIVRNFTRL